MNRPDVPREPLAFGRVDGYEVVDVRPSVAERERVRAAVKAIRERLGLTTRQFAAELGVAEVTVSRWESETDQRLPNSPAFLRILELAGYDLTPKGIMSPRDALEERLHLLERQVRMALPTMRTAAEVVGRPSVAALDPIPDGTDADYLTVPEAAAEAGVSRASVHNWIKWGWIRAYRRDHDRVVSRDDLRGIQDRRS